jgi:hypothetical protein
VSSNILNSFPPDDITMQVSGGMDQHVSQLGHEPLRTGISLDGYWYCRQTNLLSRVCSSRTSSIVGSWLQQVPPCLKYLLQFLTTPCAVYCADCSCGDWVRGDWSLPPQPPPGKESLGGERQQAP